MPGWSPKRYTTKWHGEEGQANEITQPAARMVARVIREPEIENPHHYAVRVYQLAAAYAGLFIFTLAGIVLLVWQAQFYVTLSQRSNVETLTLAFFIVLFAYFAALSANGAAGAARILYYELLARLGHRPEEVEHRKMWALGPPQGHHTTVALNMIVEAEGAAALSFTVAIGDETGSMGAIVVEGACLTHDPTVKNGSNTLLAFFVYQVNRIWQERGAAAGLDIVEWAKINDEAAEQYLGLVHFARNLERHLGAEELWPKRVLTMADRAQIERRLAMLCPALRNEAFLPQLEYAGEHRIPLIPQPLGLIGLSRTEKRVDPVTSMGCAALIVALVLVILILLILFPPWVPGA